MEKQNLTAEAVIAELSKQVERAKQSMFTSDNILRLTRTNGAYAIKEGTKTEKQVKEDIARWKKEWKKATRKWLDVSQMEFEVLKNLGLK